ncbi:hypothetical protein F5Y03DRAFT_235652 [Xylaria venustula]|nr:hypothetical protein F5Y03DRAFT_235652 [Xylaria venustula]
MMCIQHGATGMQAVFPITMYSRSCCVATPAHSNISSLNAVQLLLLLLLLATAHPHMTTTTPVSAQIWPIHSDGIGFVVPIRVSLYSLRDQSELADDES